MCNPNLALLPALRHGKREVTCDPNLALLPALRHVEREVTCDPNLALQPALRHGEREVTWDPNLALLPALRHGERDVTCDPNLALLGERGEDILLPRNLNNPWKPKKTRDTPVSEDPDFAWRVEEIMKNTRPGVATHHEWNFNCSLQVTNINSAVTQV